MPKVMVDFDEDEEDKIIKEIQFILDTEKGIGATKPEVVKKLIKNADAKEAVKLWGGDK